MGRRFSPRTDPVRCVDAAGGPGAGIRFGAHPRAVADPVRRHGLMVAGAVALNAAASRPSIAQAAFIDDAGRHVPIGASARRVFPAGAPASVFHPRRVRDHLEERLAATFEWLYRRRPSIDQMRALLATTR